MKKELRSRNKNSGCQTKPENQTRASIKKHLRKAARPQAVLKQTQCTKAVSHPNQSSEQPIQKAEPQSSETAPDIPSNLNLGQYVADIDEHISQIDRAFHRDLSQRLRVAGNIQITSDMRKILVKWLVKVGGKFRVRSETMHMCVQLIDFMLIHKGETFNKANFQLLGVTCLFISCKYNEIYTIQSEKYVQFCDGIYTVAQLFQMESLVLLAVNFNLQVPTMYQFINKIVYDFKITAEHQTVIRALADLFIFDFNSFNSYSKMELSTVIVYFTSKLYKLDELKNSLAGHKSRIQPDTFKDCFMAVVSLFKKSHLNSSIISI